MVIQNGRVIQQYEHCQSGAGYVRIQQQNYILYVPTTELAPVHRDHQMLRV